MAVSTVGEGKAAATGDVVRVVATVAAEKGGAREVTATAVATVEGVATVVAAMAVATVVEGKAAATGEVVRVEEMVAVGKGGATVATVEEMGLVEAGAAMAVEAVKAAATGEVVRVE